MMSPERLRAFGDEMLANGEFYADDAATVDEFASAWEADRSAKKLWEDAVNLTVEMLSQAVPPLTGGGLYRSVERLLKAYLQRQARIEALEKAALAVRFYYGEDSNEPLRMLDAALAAKEATGKHIVPPATAAEIRNAIGCAPEDIEAGISALECQHLGAVNSLGQCSECHKPIVGG